MKRTQVGGSHWELWRHLKPSTATFSFPAASFLHPSPPAGEDHGERVVRAAAVLRRIGRSQGAHAGALSPTVASTSLPESNLWAVFGSRALKP